MIQIFKDGRKNGRCYKTFYMRASMGMTQSRSQLGRLSTLTTDTTSQLDVLWHDSDTLGVDGAQVGVFE